jgi:hypothetical protein
MGLQQCPTNRLSKRGDDMAGSLVLMDETSALAFDLVKQSQSFVAVGVGKLENDVVHEIILGKVALAECPAFAGFGLPETMSLLS